MPFQLVHAQLQANNSVITAQLILSLGSEDQPRQAQIIAQLNKNCVVLTSK